MTPDKGIELVHQTVRWSLGFAMRDDVWRRLGFPRRPRHGTFFRRFRPAWKNSLEYRIFQELTAIATAAQVVSGLIAHELVNRFLAHLFEDPLVAVGFGFDDPFEGKSHMADRIGVYIHSLPSDWSDHFLQQIDPKAIADRRLLGGLICGSAEIGRVANRLISEMGAYGEEQRRTE